MKKKQTLLDYLRYIYVVTVSSDECWTGCGVPNLLKLNCYFYHEKANQTK